MDPRQSGTSGKGNCSIEKRKKRPPRKVFHSLGKITGRLAKNDGKKSDE